MWQRVARTVRPLHEKSPHAKTASHDTATHYSKTRYSKTRYSKTRYSKTHVHLPPRRALQAYLDASDVDVRNDKKTRRGAVVIDQKIDLHDMTRDQAAPALHAKLLAAHKHKARCVLVVTGKGRIGNGVGGGVLRRNLPSWLSDARVRHIISAYAPAHIRHGGGGAFYVFLKRNTDYS